jgi:hypothetical protein
MADQLTMKNTPISLGWEPSPLTEQANREAEDLHMRANAPMVETVMKAVSPQATPEERTKAADVFKSANEARMGDVLQAAINLNPRDLYIALTGGANVKERGYDGAGNAYGVVYNQRGEIRGYEDPITGKKLSEEQLAQIGPITSKRDVTAERQKAFQAAGIGLSEYATARTANYINTKNAAAAAGANGTLIQDLGAQNDQIAKRLSPASLDAKTLGFIRGISNIRTGDTQASRALTDKAKEVANGTRNYNDLTGDEKKSLGLNLGLQYHEGKGFRDANGNSVDTKDIDRLARSFEESQSSDKAIQTRQQDMLARAQTLAAGKVELLDSITALINNNAKIATAQNAIEQHGGIGVAKPNLPHELGNSFMSARQKAISDEFYGAASQLFYQYVKERTANLRPGQSPDIGALQAEFSSSPEMMKLRRDAAERSRIVDKENSVVAQEINKRNVIPGLTNETNRTPVQPPAETMPNRTPAGSRAPASQTTTQPTGRRSLGTIFGGSR